MRYINLNLMKHDQSILDNKIYTLDKIIEENEISVILGSPGSGKTSILENHYDQNNNRSQYIKIKRFLKFDILINESIEVLLLDGLDEYRSTANDKSLVLNELGNKINNIKGIKIIISCREMDWHGETDIKALKEEIGKDTALFRILPLDNDHKRKLADLLNIENPQIFIDKFSTYGFLENPQMFTMLANIYKNNAEYSLKNKTELFKEFVKSTREENPDYRINRINELEANEIMRFAGYISFFYMFSGVDELNDEFIDEICTSEYDYSKNNLEKTLKTKLFSENNFIHRTIAEFVLANFIVHHKLNNENPIAIERVKYLFVRKGNIPTELRGVYAWLCS